MKATHCKRGHERTEANTYLDRGARTCLACRNERKRLWAQAQRTGKAGRPAPTPKAERHPLPIGQLVWLDRDGVRTRQVVVGYRGKVVLLGGAA